MSNIDRRASRGEGTVVATECLPRSATLKSLPPTTIQTLSPSSPLHDSKGAFGSNFLSPTTLKGKQAAERNRGIKENRVQVAVRVRPFTKADGNITESVLGVDDCSIKAVKPGEHPKDFSYDYVFTEGQEEVFDCLGKPMLSDAFEGYNVTLFAYGQTGSGKTYSIMGEKDNEGLMPRFCQTLLGFAQEKLDSDPTMSIKVAMCLVEIYNEKVRDLLEKKKPGQEELTSLEVREDKDKRVYVEGVSVHTILSVERVTQLLKFGLSQRQTHETNMNETSSRSHSIAQFFLSQTHDPPNPDLKDVECIINIVDLAGSERQSKTGSTGQAFEEAKKINLSLLMLGRALNSFSEGKGGVPPLRESKLTRILSESFGGNSRTWMLACVSPSLYNYTETMSTLQYAHNAKNIINHAKVNALAQKLELRQLKIQYGLLQELFDKEKEKTRQLHLELQDRSAKIHSLSEETETLKAQLAGRPPPRRQSMKPLFVGRTKLSLKNIIQQTNNYVTLPLISDNESNDGAVLIVNTFPVVDPDKPHYEYTDPEEGIRELTGKRLDIVVHVIRAKDIPVLYSSKVYCKYVFKYKEQQEFVSTEQSGTEPEFDHKKRFSWNSITRSQAEYLMLDNVLTFEVIGHPFGSDAEAEAAVAAANTKSLSSSLVGGSPTDDSSHKITLSPITTPS